MATLHSAKNDIMTFINNGQVINAIKELRMHSGCGLKEAKDAVEDYTLRGTMSGIDNWLSKAFGPAGPVWKPDLLTTLSLIIDLDGASLRPELLKFAQEAVAAHKAG